MKKLLILALIAAGFVLGLECRPSASRATITLTTPFTQGGPNVAAVSASYAAPMAISADQVTGIMTLTVYPATAQTTNAGKSTGITPAVISPVIITINTNTGNWGTTNGLSGTLTGANLTGAQGWLASALTPAMKDAAETWMISTGVLPGTQAFPW